mmetsp:Transcript_5366/g.11076  ORF Transcript_5366/g.11076 Transcript_5366/m.11076 type:complete len:110 (-) Transcript_5366:578-907(-)
MDGTELERAWNTEARNKKNLKGGKQEEEEKKRVRRKAKVKRKEGREEATRALLVLPTRARALAPLSLLRLETVCRLLRRGQVEGSARSVSVALTNNKQSVAQSINRSID